MRDGRDHDGGQHQPPEIAGDDDRVDDASAAFLALRATVEDLATDLGRDMGVIRKAVEAALVRFDRQGAPVDYGADLARLTKGLTVVGERLGAMEQAPALRQGAEHYARALERGGQGLVREAVEGLERQTDYLRKIRDGMARDLAGARERRDQQRWLVGVGAGAFVLGVLATVFMTSVLPGPIGRFVASMALGADYWNGGAALMRSGSPAGWQAILESSALAKANKEALAGCREAAAKTGKEQRCTLVVTAPSR